jgi:hypothetical protein
MLITHFPEGEIAILIGMNGNVVKVLTFFGLKVVDMGLI